MSRRNKEKGRLERVRLHRLGLEPFDLLKLTAFHEAGHVVFATLHDNPVEIVTIDPQKVLELTGRNCPGYTRYSKWGLANANYVLDMTAAGLTAEAMLVSGGVINPEEDDLLMISCMLDKMELNGADKQHEFVSMKLRVEDFVLKHRAQITSVANALMEKKTLTGEDVAEVLKAA
jgi:ATP-dependent Zn protease